MARKFSKKTIPLWLAMLLILDVVAAVGLGQNYLLKRRFQKQLQEVTVAADPQALVRQATQKVLPAEGYTTSLSWEDIGVKLVEAGAIDEAKYAQIFDSNTNGKLELEILQQPTDKKINIDENNSRFIVNTLWALGLTNKSKVLDKGPMKTGQTPTENFASTAGWTLGKKDAMDLYSSQEIIPLTDEQQDLVQKIAANVFRPCCGNSTAFPDCNHGMAALGYIELAVAKGLSEAQIYKDLLAFNSFWFPQTYVEMVVYFQKEKSLSWDKVDPKLALSVEYSSYQGAQKISQAVKNVPGLESQGGSCGT